MTTIESTTNGPFIVKDLPKLTNAKGENIESKSTLALCRCGGSLNKPYCDGTHGKIGYSSKKDRTDKEHWDIKEAKADKVTVVDDVNICCHAGFCSELKDVFWTFDKERNRFSHPEKADSQQVINTIKRCPSGSIMYKLGDKLQEFTKRQPQILVSKNGPLWVMGSIEFSDQENNAKPTSTERYTLCRCGASKNKPFCDGQHAKVGFSD